MQRTKIEWVKNLDGTQGYTINPIKGLCPMDCKDNRGKSYCYARRMYQRFKWNPKIRVDFNVMLDTGNIRKPSRIFVGSTMELFGDWVNPVWLQSIFDWVKTDIGIHTYIFLTKKPENLIKWSPFPANCYIGMSVDKMSRYGDITDTFASIKASVKFVSFEPMLDYTPPDLRYVDWVIIGGMTPYSQKTAPRANWVKSLTEIAKEQDIPVFHKDNLGMIFDADGFPKRQEYPVIKG